MRFTETTRKPPPDGTTAEPRIPVLVIAHHPTLARVGDSLAIHDRALVARLAPAFGGTDRDPAPLDDPFVSRKAIVVRREGDDVIVENPAEVELAIGGVELRGARRVTADELARGIDLVLGNRIVLWLTLDHAGTSDELGMFGASRSLHALRDAIRAAAQTPGPILVDGETGTGKELVARALHARSPRAGKPLVAVNVAAIPASVATAELFGHEKHAFTGAADRRAGYFERADGGVLFLDEIGDLPEAVQPILLRALESGEIQPVGGSPRKVDALVIAATDADLARASQAGRYRGPLYYRLAGTTLHVPPLRERRVDIGPLLARFLLELLGHDAALVDQATSATPWLPASVATELVRAAWPGNIRQLRAIASRLATIARSGGVVALDQLGATLGLDEEERDQLATEREPAQPLDDTRLISVLRAHQFRLSPAAEQLGISRTHLDALIARSGLRKAKDVAREEIEAAAAELAGDVEAMAAKLEVSPRGLKLRMRQLGL
jgi:two-component system nitrogen regulation response regulator GlnG